VSGNTTTSVEKREAKSTHLCRNEANVGTALEEEGVETDFRVPAADDLVDVFE
jgi:hypothetical protein